MGIRRNHSKVCNANLDIRLSSDDVMMKSEQGFLQSPLCLLDLNNFGYSPM